jgi:hypothetical protein
MTVPALQSGSVELRGSQNCGPTVSSEQRHDRGNESNESDEQTPRGEKVCSSDSFDSFPKAFGNAALHGLAGEIVRFLEPNTEADPAGVMVPPRPSSCSRW